MIKFSYGLTAAAVEEIKPRLLSLDGQTQDEFAQQIINSLTADPLRTYLLLIHETNPDGSPVNLVGFLLASWDQPKPFVWLAQAWINPNYRGAPFNRAMFLRLADWAEQRGLHEIQTRAKDDADSLRRLWGFELHSTILCVKTATAFNPPQIVAGSAGGARSTTAKEFN
jgi:hypothetical protein